MSFLQVLEGPEAAVEACFERIGRDKRHHRIILMIEQEAGARAFPDWRMGFARPGQLAAGAREKVLSIYDIYEESGFGESGAAPEDAPEVKSLINSFLGSFRELSL